MGTFGKAIGSFGAYIACSNIVRSYLINRCGGFIYSTALPPILIEATMKLWRAVKGMKYERNLLLENAKLIRKGLQKLNLETQPNNSNSHIIPIIIGCNDKVMRIQEKLKSKSILASAIRPPTVPEHTARLRLSLTVKHNKDQIIKLLNTLSSI